MYSRRRTLRAAFGAVQVVLTLAFGAVFGFAVSPVAGAGILLFGVSGLLFVCAGLRDRVEVAGLALGWQQVDGVGTLTLAAACVLGVVPQTRSDPIFAGLIVAGALALGFFGYQELIDGPHVDLTADPSRRRLLAIGALIAVSLAGGIVLALVAGG